MFEGGGQGGVRGVMSLTQVRCCDQCQGGEGVTTVACPVGRGGGGGGDSGLVPGEGKGKTTSFSSYETVQ